MPHVFERAPTGRAKCRGCEQRIAAGSFRFGERLPNPFSDNESEMTHWFHPICAAFKRPEPFLEALAATDEPLDDRDVLEREARLGVAHHRLPRVNTAERAASGRATCRACKEKIEQGSWRLTLVYYEDGRFAPSGFIHAGCAASYLDTTEVLPRVAHFTDGLTQDDMRELAAAVGA
jgi:ribosomal protein L37AE/L43A